MKHKKKTKGIDFGSPNFVMWALGCSLLVIIILSNSNGFNPQALLGANKVSEYERQQEAPHREEGVRITTSSPIPTKTAQITKAINTVATDAPQKDSGYGYPCDNEYASASEIFNALNQYRNTHGAGSLSWNDKLAEVASMRVQQTLAGGRDYHAGFREFTSNNDNFQKVGFATLSENIGSSAGCPLSGVHLIEFKISKSPAHDSAQRDPAWQAVGISTSNGITSFIFGRDPI